VLLGGLGGIVAGAPGLLKKVAGGRLHTPDPKLFTAQPPALQIHIVALAFAVVLGAALMASRKGRAFHRAAGWTWAGTVLAGSAALVWLGVVDGRWGPLDLLLIYVLPLMVTGLWFARRHRESVHGACMMWLFYGSIVFPGALTLLPGRLLWRLFFG